MAGALVCTLALSSSAYAQEPVCPEGVSKVACRNSDPTDGYVWIFGNAWVPGYPSVDAWFMRMPEWSRGRAVYYEANVMEGTARYRGLSLDGYLDGIATMTCSEIGETVWVRREGFDWEGPYLVVDCAGRGDIWPVIRYRREVIEVGWQTKLLWETDWPVEVEVLLYDPALGLPDGTPVDFPEWWLERATFSGTQENRPLDHGDRVWTLDGVRTEFAEIEKPAVPVDIAGPEMDRSALAVSPTPLYLTSAPDGAKGDKPMQQFLEQLVTWYGTQLLTILVLVVVFVVLRIAAAVQTGVFEWAKLGDFLHTVLAPKILGFIGAALLSRFALGPALGFDPVILETTAFTLVVVTLVGDILANLQLLGIIPGPQAGRLAPLGIPAAAPPTKG